MSNVTNMIHTFLGARAFNADISRWDVRKVTSMNGLFLSANSFSQNIGGWDVSSNNDMLSMFSSASSFNQDLSPWNVTRIAPQPTDFNSGTSSLTSGNLPVWGTWPSNKASMFSIIFSSGRLSQTFSSNTISYTLIYVTLPFTITPYVIPGCTVTVNGAVVTSRSASTPLTSFADVSIIVTARNGTTTKTYTFKQMLNNYHYTFYTVSEYTPTVMSRTVYDNVGNLIDTTDISYGGQTITNALATMNGGGTNPFTLGIVDSSRNKIKMDLAYSNVYTKALNPTQKTKLMSYVNTTFKEPHTIFTYQYVVTVSGGSYWIATFPSVTPVKTPTITFTAGSTYIFDQSHVSNIGKPIALTRSDESVYSTGVTTIGTIGQSVNAYTQVIIPSGFSESLRYYELPPTEKVGRIRFKSNQIAGTAGLQYGRLTAMSGDGKRYAFTSGSSVRETFHVFSAINNTIIGLDISNAVTNYEVQDFKLNSDGSLLFSSSTYNDERLGTFQAHFYNGTSWASKGAVRSTTKTSSGANLGAYGGFFVASDNGNIVHMSYSWNASTELPTIHTFLHNGTDYVWRSRLQYDGGNDGQTWFGRIMSGITSNGRFAVGARDGAAAQYSRGKLLVYDWNSSDSTYTKVGSTVSIPNSTETYMPHTTISYDGTIVAVKNFNSGSGPYYIYKLVSGAWTLKYTGGGSSTLMRPSLNVDGSLFAVSSYGVTGASNKVNYYISNDTSYNLIKTIDLSRNITGVQSIAFSTDLYSFASGQNFYNSNTGVVDVYST